MGFSPGDFSNRDGTQVHWEIKDGPRIVLWDAHESTRLLGLDLKNATRARDLLDLLVTLGGDA